MCGPRSALLAPLGGLHTPQRPCQTSKRAGRLAPHARAAALQCRAATPRHKRHSWDLGCAAGRVIHMVGFGSAFGWLPPAGTPNKSRQCRSSGSALLSFCAAHSRFRLSFQGHNQALLYMPEDTRSLQERKHCQPQKQAKCAPDSNVALGPTSVVVYVAMHTSKAHK